MSNGTECAAYLRKYNEWRRGDPEDNRESEMPHPREIGLAIDMAIELIKQRNELLNMLWKALPFVEDHEGCDGYKPETIKKTVEQIKRVLKAAESHGQPEKQPETSVPALVFYPAGSLGEEVAL